MGDIAQRLSGKKDPPPCIQDIEELSKYLATFYNRQYCDSTGLHLAHGFKAGQVELHIHVDQAGCFVLEVRSRQYQNAETSLFKLMISEGAITAASADPFGVEWIEYDLESLDMIFEFVIPALGCFDDILKVTDGNTVYMLRRVGTAYAQRKILRLIAENAEGRRFEEMQEFLRVCVNLDIQHVLLRQRASV